MVRRIVLIAGALAAAVAAVLTFVPFAASQVITSTAYPGGTAEPIVSVERSRIWDSAWTLFVIWVPVAVAAAPLLRVSRRFQVAATMIAALLLLMFVVVAGFSIGLLYAPAVVAMLFAAGWALGRTEPGSAS